MYLIRTRSSTSPSSYATANVPSEFTYVTTPRKNFVPAGPMVDAPKRAFTREPSTGQPSGHDVMGASSDTRDAALARARSAISLFSQVEGVQASLSNDQKNVPVPVRRGVVVQTSPPAVTDGGGSHRSVRGLERPWSPSLAAAAAPPPPCTFTRPSCARWRTRARRGASLECSMPS